MKLKKLRQVYEKVEDEKEYHQINIKKKDYESQKNKIYSLEF